MSKATTTMAVVVAAAAAVATTATTTTTAPAEALPAFRQRIPNGMNVPGTAGVGHINRAGGGDLNRFGADFKAAGFRWTPELCKKDSDGDGLTNGQELGDPACVWRQGQTPSRTTGITHPGVRNAAPSTSCSPRGQHPSFG